MKPASLGLVTPGMRMEYRVSADTVAWLPFAALAGTVVGSCVWGVLADIYGRRASIVLSSVMFVGTSICGAMPSLWWNVGMCFMMGAAAGGMLPVAYALLAEVMPTRHRGWSLVLVGGIGALGGFFAASSLSALLQPVFGWRIMWFLNLPTGLILVALSPLLPESARFLQQTGRTGLARAVLARFGVTLTAVMVLGMLGLAVQELGAGGLSRPVIPLTLLILGSSGVISMLLPYAAENYPLRIRGRATGWVAACSKLGGLVAQTLSVVAGVPPFAAAILSIAVPAAGSTILIALFGRASRGRSPGELGARDAVRRAESTT